MLGLAFVEVKRKREIDREIETEVDRKVKAVSRPEGVSFTPSVISMYVEPSVAVNVSASADGLSLTRHSTSKGSDRGGRFLRTPDSWPIS